MTQAKQARRPTKQVEDLYLLLFRLNYTMRDVCRDCGMEDRTPSRWKTQGFEPRPATFERILGAMVDMGIRDGKLPERARGASVSEVLDMGVVG